MGLFNLFKSQLDDPALTRLRDLIIMGAADSDYTMHENETIVTICHQMHIPVSKIEKVFELDPEKIRDIYPTTPEAKADYLLQLIEVMVADNVCEPEEIKMLYAIARYMSITRQQVDDTVEQFCQSINKKSGEKIWNNFLANK